MYTVKIEQYCYRIFKTILNNNDSSLHYLLVLIEMGSMFHHLSDFGKCFL